MGKSETLVVLLLISSIHCNVMQKISWHLERVYDYILKNHDLMNVDCIFGVVLSQAFLAEVNSKAFGNPQKIQQLTAKGSLIISKTIARLEKSSMLNKMLIEIAFDPIKWQRQVRFKFDLLDGNDTKQVIGHQDFLRALAHTSFNETFSDNCMLELLRGPQPSTNTCKISSRCRKIMLNQPDLGTGYYTTHRVLYLQLSRIAGCNTDRSKISKYCSKLFLETQLMRRFGLIEPLQDLLFEEVTLCGMEGYAEFMQDSFLEAAEMFQHDNGCYGDGLRVKREANVIGGGCVDHTTGLGASILSLFLKYYSQKFI